MRISEDTKQWVKRIGLNVCLCDPPIETYLENDIALYKVCGGVVC